MRKGSVNSICIEPLNSFIEPSPRSNSEEENERITIETGEEIESP
jgi:hypothetical protein